MGEKVQLQRFFIQSFFASIPDCLCLPRHAQAKAQGNRRQCTRTATKARGQNTEHDRVARSRRRQRHRYLGDRVHGKQRQRAPPRCHRHRHRCHRRDIPGIWRFGRNYSARAHMQYPIKRRVLGSVSSTPCPEGSQDAGSRNLSLAIEQGIVREHSSTFGHTTRQKRTKKRLDSNKLPSVAAAALVRGTDY